MCVAVFPTICLQIHFNNSQIYSVLGEALEPCDKRNDTQSE